MSKVIERTLGIVAIILILLSLSGCSTITEGVIAAAGNAVGAILCDYFVENQNAKEFR